MAKTKKQGVFRSLNLLDRATSRISQDVSKTIKSEVKKEIKKFTDTAATATPVPQQEAPIAWNYPMAYNARYGRQRKREEHTLIGFDRIRQLARAYPVSRACINYRKNQLKKLRWDIVAEDENIEANETISKAIKEFFKEPSGMGSTYRKFSDRIVTDLLEIDAVAIAKEKTLGGELNRLIPIDAATIRLNVDGQGLTPQPPEIAYRQYIRGKLQAEMTVEEMLYDFMNPSTNSPYGFSVMETLILTVNTALRVDSYNFNYFKEGNVPEGLATVPPEWTNDQIRDFQSHWDAMLTDPRRMRWVPDGTDFIKTRDEAIDQSFKVFSHWLMNVTCAVFAVPPEELGFTTTVNKSTSESQNKVAIDSGLRPLAMFMEEIFTKIIQKDMSQPNLRFAYLDIDPTDEQMEIQKLESDVKLGIVSTDEVRAERGLEKLDIPPFIMTSTGPVLIKELQLKQEDLEINGLPKMPEFAPQPPQDEEESPSEDEELQEENNPVKEKPTEKIEDLRLNDMRKWRRRAINDIKRGRNSTRSFESEYIDEELIEEVEEQLATVGSVREVAKVFDSYMTTTGTILRQLKGLEHELQKSQTDIQEDN
jgi:phage portal protein BeeE